MNISLLLATLFILSAASTACFSFVCDDELLKEVKSHNQERVATAYVRNCGATTGYATQVTVRWTSSSPESTDLVFSVDSKREIQIEWLDDLTLIVRCPNCSENQVYKRVVKQGKVEIKFE